jgi:signal transduction histidine kinase
MRFPHVSYTRSLATRQILLVLGVTLVVGLTVSSLLLRCELNMRLEESANETRRLFAAMLGPASQAAFNLDKNQARQVVQSLVAHPSVQRAAVFDEAGSSLGTAVKPVARMDGGFLSSLFLPAPETIKQPLFFEPMTTRVGTLEISVHYSFVAQALARHLKLNLTFELGRGLLLAVALGLLLHFDVIRHILGVSRQVAELEPDSAKGFSSPVPPEPSANRQTACAIPKNPPIRIPPGHRRDELGLLIKNINSVFHTYAETLASKNCLEKELQALNRELEAKIAAGTEELQRHADKLRTEIEERKRAEANLEGQRNLLMTLFEELQAGIVVFDPVLGKVTNANSVAQRLFNLDLNTIRDISCSTGDYLLQTRTASISLLCPEYSGENTYDEGALILPDGKSMPVARYCFKVFLEGHEQIVQVIFDTTERKNLERQLAIAQRLESIGLLAAGLAHEINTPIQYVGDSITFLKDAFDDIARILEAYERLAAASRNIQELHAALADVEEIRDDADLPFLLEQFPKAYNMALGGVHRVSGIVLAMKKFSRAGTEDMKPVDINTALESTVTVARNEWKYVADVETDLDPELPLVQCLAGDMNQVFLNVLINAAHAVREVGKDKEGDGDKGLIRITTRRDGDHVRIEFEDTGCGIAPENRERIFDPFFTTKEVGKGTGQGLAIVHDIVVDKHNGSIEVESNVEQGTRFIIRIPLSQPESTDQDAS